MGSFHISTYYPSITNPYADGFQVFQDYIDLVDDAQD